MLGQVGPCVLVAVALAVTATLAAQQPPNCALGGFIISPDATTWVCKGTGTPPEQVTGGGAALPQGAIVLIASGTCPAGYAESAALSGKFLRGTDAASGNVGTTGGADTIIPAGENSNGAVSAHAGTAVADHASHTHTYADVLNHTHTVNVTDPGHSHTQASTTTATGATSNRLGTVDTSSTAVNTGSAATGVTAATVDPAGGVATGTTAGPSATLTHSVTQPNAHTFTQPTVTGTQFDNRPAFVRVIACAKS